MSEATVRVSALKVSAGGAEETNRVIPEETPVAFVYDGSTYAVMMATPADLEDFAVGFSLTEGIIGDARDILEREVIETDGGTELRMWLAAHEGRSLGERRRRIAGPTGCGLCGVESLAAAVPKPPAVGIGTTVSADDIHRALEAMAPAQNLNARTRAVHAAGFWSKPDGLVALREDVGRHNALDKLVGALARKGVTAANGVVVLTSRVSVEMVQKSARLGASIIVAVSAPTRLALETAAAAGITLVAVARQDAFEIFTHPHRIAVEKAADPCTRHEVRSHAPVV